MAAKVSIVLGAHLLNACRSEADKHHISISEYVRQVLWQRHGLQSASDQSIAADQVPVSDESYAREHALRLMTGGASADDDEADTAQPTWICGPCYVCNYLDMANCHKCGKPRAEVEQK